MLSDDTLARLTTDCQGASLTCEEIEALAREVQQARKLWVFLDDFCQYREGHSRTAYHVRGILRRWKDQTT